MRLYLKRRNNKIVVGQIINVWKRFLGINIVVWLILAPMFVIGTTYFVITTTKFTVFTGNLEPLEVSQRYKMFGVDWSSWSGAQNVSLTVNPGEFVLIQQKSYNRGNTTLNFKTVCSSDSEYLTFKCLDDVNDCDEIVYTNSNESININMSVSGSSPLNKTFNWVCDWSRY